MNRRYLTRFASKLLGSTAVFGCALLSACSSPPEASAVEQGRKLFESKALSQSHLNDYTCATCHDTVASDPPSKKTGSALAGVTLRPSFWGDQVGDLLGAVNACRSNFMGDTQLLSPNDAQARSLYAYLVSLEPGVSDAIPFTVVNTIEALPRAETAEGNADAANHGQLLYAQACASCHGSMHEGTGRLSSRVPILPEQTIAEHAQYSHRVQRLIFTEKIRHGLFLGYGGNMPPFSTELLSDQDVSDVLEAFGVLGAVLDDDAQ
ncbi:MAG TPA: c-type cytochrome [Polyangiaceae bacterium]|nr:c-type cytochrome [Polyangiaceae bacterium]